MSLRIPDVIAESFPHAEDLLDDLSDTEFEGSAASARGASAASNTRRCVVLTGLPVIAENKLSKLQSFIQKLCDAVSY